ncbi:MAG TPA: fluoride efflux transporter CrcB [Vicinamibacteria bacterium]|nr:fluoride efflux transporter CrcB [Vicinamibacteria bacterium]
MGRLLWISAGGALGTAARYLLSVWLLEALGPAFPYGTLAVNVIGSFLLGVIMHVGLTTSLLTPTARMVLGAGVMGGFTTYSTFNYETLRYLQDGAWGMAALNVGTTLVVCLAAGALGVAAARLMVG